MTQICTCFELVRTCRHWKILLLSLSVSLFCLSAGCLKLNEYRVRRSSFAEKLALREQEYLFQQSSKRMCINSAGRTVFITAMKKTQFYHCKVLQKQSHPFRPCHRYLHLSWASVTGITWKANNSSLFLQYQTVYRVDPKIPWLERSLTHTCTLEVIGHCITLHVVSSYDIVSLVYIYMYRFVVLAGSWPFLVIPFSAHLIPTLCLNNSLIANTSVPSTLPIDVYLTLVTLCHCIRWSVNLYRHELFVVLECVCPYTLCCLPAGWRTIASENQTLSLKEYKKGKTLSLRNLSVQFYENIISTPSNTPLCTLYVQKRSQYGIIGAYYDVLMSSV